MSQCCGPPLVGPYDLPHDMQPSCEECGWKTWRILHPTGSFDGPVCNNKSCRRYWKNYEDMVRLVMGDANAKA